MQAGLGGQLDRDGMRVTLIHTPLVEQILNFPQRKRKWNVEHDLAKCVFQLRGVDADGGTL